MSKPERWPVALTIAGSDSGGGAGIQADLKTFASLDVHGTSALTAITAQNPRGVSGIQACTAPLVRRQIEAVFAAFNPAAVKTGMLFSTPIVRTVAEFFARRPRVPLIVDPVMVATSGAPLLRAGAVKALREELFPRAALVTPNRAEAAMLLGGAVDSVEALRAAARDLHGRWSCAVLVKGGHLRGQRVAVDCFVDDRHDWLLEAPRVRGVSTHGTGCTLAAAIAGYVALGCDVPYAVQLGKAYISRAIGQHVVARGHAVLQHFWK